MRWTTSSARKPSLPDEMGLRPEAMASPKSRNCRSNGASGIAIASDAPEATSCCTGAGGPESLETSQVVSLSPEMIAVPLRAVDLDPLRIARPESR